MLQLLASSINSEMIHAHSKFTRVRAFDFILRAQ